MALRDYACLTLYKFLNGTLSPKNSGHLPISWSSTYNNNDISKANNGGVASRQSPQPGTFNTLPMYPDSEQV